MVGNVDLASRLGTGSVRKEFECAKVLLSPGYWKYGGCRSEERGDTHIDGLSVLGYNMRPILAPCRLHHMVRDSNQPSYSVHPLADIATRQEPQHWSNLLVRSQEASLGSFATYE